MRPIVVLLLLTASLSSLAPVASATHDACRVEDVEGEPECLVDFLLNRRCIYNPVWYVDPEQPQYAC